MNSSARTRLHFLKQLSLPFNASSSRPETPGSEKPTGMKALEDLNEELKHFNEATSHDLKTLLFEIQISVQLLERKLVKEKISGNQESFDQIYRSVETMRALIKDAMVYANVGHIGKKKPEELDLNQIVARVLRDLDGSIRLKKMRVDVGKLPYITAHGFHIREVFQNLISNAVKYSSPRVKVPFIKIYAEQTRDSVVIRVVDNGIGFEEKDSGAIFEPYHRLFANQCEGNGLGLAICRKILGYYDGEILAESVPGQGSTFTIRFPNSANVTPPLPGFDDNSRQSDLSTTI